jgi:hypothetical protein
MSTATVTVETKTDLERKEILATIFQRLSDAKEAIQEAANIFAAAVKADPNFRSWAMENAPNGNKRLFLDLEAVGTGRIDYRLVSGDVNNSHALRSLPLPDQLRFIEGSIEILTENGETLLVSGQNLTKDQFRQCFHPTHIRSLEEQKAWIESQKTKKVITGKKTSRPILEPDKKNRCILFDGRSIPISHVMDVCRRVME